MKVEMKVDWAELPKEPRKKPERAFEGPEPPRSRVERRLWYIAVAREIEAGVRSGRFGSFAAAARSCRVSRARISQLPYSSST